MKQLQSSGVLFPGAVVALLAAQPVYAQATEVTAVRLSPTNRSLNVVLETSTSNRPQVFTAKRGNTLVAYIINAQLRLPQKNSFRQDNPASGIASIAVTQMDAKTIQMVITGSTSAPSSQGVRRNAQGITLGFSPSTGTVARVPAASPQPAATPAPAQPQPGQTPTAQAQNVLVPNPEVTIDGVPLPATRTASPVTPAPPPFLPRAIAPPVGDIAVSNEDSSPAVIELGTTERVPRLVLRDAPVREVLALLARAAGLNLAYTTAPAPGGQQGQPDQTAAGGEGPKISLDIENESVQDVFNYVLRISGLDANRTGRTIFVGPRLPNQARNVIVRSLRLNQVTVGVALNFLVGMGAESAVSRERVVTSVNAVPVGGSATPATQTQTSTETRLETQRIDLQDSLPLLRGLEALGDERTNSVTLVGAPRQVEIATSQLVQLDTRRRQVAVNVKIVDINLLATEDFNTSFSFGIGDNFFSSAAGVGTVNVGRYNPPDSATLRSNVYSPPRTTLDNNGATSTSGNSNISVDTVLGAIGSTIPGVDINNNTSLRSALSNVLGSNNTTTGSTNFFTYPRNFLASLQAQVVSGNAKILTDPTLIVQEGQQANVNLTSQVVGNIQTLIVRDNGGSTQTITAEKENVGLTLSIRIERVDDNGFISLSVAPVVKAPSEQRVINLGQGQSQTIFLTSERSLNSGLVRLRDSQTLILSGIIQDQDRTTVTKVPILGDIPILGALFRSTNRSKQRQEVVVLLTPQIIDDSERSSVDYNYPLSPNVRQMLERQQGGGVPKK